MKSFRKNLLLALFLATPFVFFSCKKIENPRTELVFGTVCTLNAYNDGTAEIYNELFAKLHQIDNLFSTTISTSEIEKINAAAGVESVKASDEVVSVLKIALSFAKATDGIFDPTIGPIVKLWGINTEFAHVPTEDEIRETLKLVNWKNVQIDGNNVFLTEKGMRIDLGGIVKGYAADALTFILKNRDVKSAVVDLGGNVFVYGQKKDKTLWRVGIKNPQNPTGSPELVLAVPQSTVVTSGVYERFFIQDGIRYHHIINPKTGYPVDNGLTSTSIICSSSTAADALSTTLFILGVEDGWKFVEEMKNNNKLTEINSSEPKEKERVADGMGAWLYDGIPTENNQIQVTAEGLPYLPAMQGMQNPIEAIFIDDQDKIFASEEIRKFIQ